MDLHRYALVYLLVHSVELHLRGMLKLSEFDACATNEINSLHESFHTLPHAHNRLFKLLGESGGQRNFIVAEDLAYLGCTWWMLLKVHLPETTIIWVR